MDDGSQAKVSQGMTLAGLMISIMVRAMKK
jgi:hypothetical protein